MKAIAALLLALMTMAPPAQAYTISPKVGPLLKEAQVMIAAKNYAGATAKLDEAEAVKAYADDESIINQFRHAIRVKTLVCHPGERYRVIDKMVEPCPQP